MDPQERVYTFKNVSVTIEGIEHAVSSITLILRETSIPMLRLVIDPKHTAKDAVIPASTASLSSIADSLVDLLKAAELKSTATKFSFEMYGWKNNKPNQLIQELKLDNWVLNSAGMVGVSASGNFSLELELLHPIALTQMGGQYRQRIHNLES